MRKIITLLFVIVSLSTCKKSETESLKSQMTGTWYYTTFVTRDYQANGTLDHTNTYIAISGDNIKFNSDGTYVQSFPSNHTLTGTYEITSNTTFT